MPIPVGPGLDLDVTDGVADPGTLIHDGSLTLGAITLGYVDDYGVEWGITKLTGWDSQETTGQVEQRAADHGGWTNQAYYLPRIVMVEGWLQAATWSGASRSIDRLKAAIPLSDLDTMIIAEAGDRILQADVRQADAVMVDRVNGWARFSLSLLAPDPRRYDVIEQTDSTGLPVTTGGLSLPITLPITIGATTASGRVSILNEGNMSTRPVMAINGPCPPATITHIGSGKRLLIPEAVDAGRQLVLDFDTRTALLDGTALRYVTGAWFDLEPGLNEIAFEAAAYDADAELFITFRSAWK